MHVCCILQKIATLNISVLALISDGVWTLLLDGEQLLHCGMADVNVSSSWLLPTRMCVLVLLLLLLLALQGPAQRCKRVSSKLVSQQVGGSCS